MTGFSRDFRGSVYGIQLLANDCGFICLPLTSALRSPPFRKGFRALLAMSSGLRSEAWSGQISKSGPFTHHLDLVVVVITGVDRR
jgi:hypothetical protein